MMQTWWRRPSWWWIGAGVAAVVAVGIVLWPTSSPRTLPPPRALVYNDFQACLLTGSHGLNDAKVTPVWEGMQDASKATQAKVSYLTATGGDAGPYLATLLQRKCNIVLAAGTAQSAAAIEQAAKHPDVRFVVVGSSGAATNVTVLPDEPADRQRAAIARLIGELVTK